MYRFIFVIIGALIFFLKSSGFVFLDDYKLGKEEYYALDATVISVYDGDTITVMTKNGKQRVRLYGIDAPEREQVYGAESRKFLADYIDRKDVTLHVFSIDQYGRLVAIVLKDDVDINAKMVRNGKAWSYDGFSNRYTELCKKARKEKRGLFGLGSEPLEPWRYRKKQE